MPPEILHQKSYGKNIDWYLCGVLLYEMLTGLPPYFHKNSKLIQKNIMSSKLIIPKDLSPECRNLLKALLDKDPVKRLGFKDGAAEILKHPWFGGLTLEEIESTETTQYGAYLAQSPEAVVSDIDSALKHKMEDFNLIFQKQMQRLLYD